MQSAGWLYSLSQYWREAINSAIEGRIEDRELAEKFLEASSDALKPEDVRTVIREEIEKAFNEGKINFYLIADAVQSAPDIDMLSFAYDSFKKAEHVEAPGKDIARLSLAAHFFYLGYALYEQKNFENSIEDFNKAIKLNPDDAEAYGNRGLAYAELGEHDRAREDMLRAGNLFTNKGRIEDAIRACGVIFKLNIGEESERVIAGYILLLHSYISGSDSANDIEEKLNEMGYMDEEVLRNAIERLKRREESRWLIPNFLALLRVYNRMRGRRENHH